MKQKTGKGYAFLHRLIVYAVIFLMQISYAFGQVSSRSHSNGIFPADTSIKIVRLPNGFTCYLKKCKSKDKNVYMQFSVKAGFAFEDSNEIGLSHLIEHMAKNTKHFKESVSYFMKKGLPRDNRTAITGGYLTNYKAKVPASDKNMISDVIYHLSECAQLINMDDENIENQRQSVILEISKATYPEITARLKTNEFLYGNKKLMVEGHLQSLKNFRPDDVRTLYEKVYVPERQVLIIAGDIDVENIAAQVKKRFAYLKRGKNTVDDNLHPDLNSNKFLIVGDTALNDCQFWVAYKSSLPAKSTIDHYRMAFEHKLLSHLFEIRFSSITNKKADEHITITSDLKPSAATLLGYDMFIHSIHYSGKLYNEAWKVYAQEWERLKQFGFTQTELIKAIERLKNEWNEVSEKPCEEIIEYAISAYLEKTNVPDLQQLLRLQNGWLNEIDVRSANAILKAACNDGDRKIALLTSDLQLQQPMVEKAVQHLDIQTARETLAPHEDDDVVELMTPEEIKSLRPSSILSVNTDEQSNITQILLSNGTKIVLKPLQTANGDISIHGFNKSISALLVNEADFQQATNNVAIWSRMGAGKFSHKQLAAFADFKSIIYYFTVNENGSKVNVTCSRKTELESALQLIYLLLNSPDTSALSFKEAVNGIVTDFVPDSNADKSFVDSVMVALGKSSGKQADVNEIKKTDLRTLINAYRRYFNPGGFTFVIAGNFTKEAILPLVAKYLGAMTSSPQKTPQALNKDSVKYFYLNKPNVTVLRMHIVGLFDDIPKQHVILNALEAIMNVEGLVKAQQSGLSYYAGMGLTTTIEQGYDLSFWMSLDTVNYKKGLEFCDKLLERIRKGEFSDTLVAYVRNKLLVDFKNKADNSAFWTKAIAEQLLKKRPFSDIFEYKEAVEKLTKEDIVKGAQQYLNEALMHYFVSLPEKIN